MNEPSFGNQPTASGAPHPPDTDARSLGARDTLRAEAQRKRYRAGDRLLGRYRIIGELGQGGMGVVFHCFDETGGIDVALKALPPELAHDTGEMEEVRENFRLVQGLAHPNIAQIKTLEHDAGTGDYFLVMERVEGINLRQWRRQAARKDIGYSVLGIGETAPDSQPNTQYPIPSTQRHRSLSEVLPILRQVAAALDYAHAEKIVHRDIKPANIMVRPDRAVKVLDFGLAAQIHSSLTRVSQVHDGTSGTGPYMAPEQWKGWRQDAATDQYALAVVAYELLAGAPPFDAPDAAVLKEIACKEQPRRIEGLDDRTWKALARALSKDPAVRFSTCTAFVEALSGAGTTGGPTAQRAGIRYWVLGVVCLLAALATWRFVVAPSGAGRRAPDRPFPREEAPDGATTNRATPARPPARVATGSVRVMVEVPVEAMDWLSRTEKRVKVGDGAWQPISRLPYTIGNLACTSTEVSLDVTGFTVDAVSRRVPVADGETVDASFVLTLKPALLTIDCAAPGAEIFDATGAHLGAAGAPISLTPLTVHMLTVRTANYRPATIDLPAMEPESKTRKQVLLTKIQGSVRIEADAPAAALEFLARTPKRAKIGDGEWQAVKTLPFTVDGLACAPTEVYFEADGFTVVAAINRVSPRDGQTAEARCSLTPKPAQLTIECAAPGAEILDATGARVCAAGAPVALAAFTAYTLTVRATNHTPATVTVVAMDPEAKVSKHVALEEQKEPNPGEETTVDLSGGIKLTLHWCPAGTFMMGTPPTEDSGVNPDVTKVQHKVTLTRGFWMGKYEVTQTQWKQVMGSNPSHFKGVSLPVEQVSWDDCMEFVRKVNVRVPGGGFRLPTEAEWEYACRAGTTTAFNNGNELHARNANINADGYYDKSLIRRRTLYVGSFPPNAWGLYDMHGNVREWCSDWFGDYPSGVVTNPVGPDSGTRRVLRSGGWDTLEIYSRSASRGAGMPDERLSDPGLMIGGKWAGEFKSDRGLRLVRTAQ